MSDLINRQDVLNAIHDVAMEDEQYKIWLEIAIKNLPSAEPEIIRCKYCKWWDEFPCSTATPEYHECRRTWFSPIRTKADEFCSRAKRIEEGDYNGEIESTD